jgi:tRNA-uridine 2-sulfurtransferase
MENRPKVVIAMSGGVDSSVAAALLVKQGYEVIGIMMRLWSEPGKHTDNRCCTPDAMASARRVAARLDIPFYAVDAQEIFFSKVVNYFMEGYIQGNTPNPCLECNRYVRWEFLLNRARALGADAMATGHYARLAKDSQGRIQLLRAVDAAKDQSYVLHVLGQEQLAQAIFPLGEYSKPQVRQMAREFNIPSAERADSQDLCFLGDGDYRSFITRHAREQVERPGPINNRAGQEIGRHQGLAFYTIGQRKGLGIASTQPLYVLQKDLHKNVLIVGGKDELGQRELLAERVNWISGEAPPDRIRAQVKIRYKSREAWANVTPMQDDLVHVRFDEPLRDITPGQATVFYQDEVCLGGGVIREANAGGDHGG